MTKVINIEDAPYGWKHNSDYVYIGRGGPWGNPFKIGINTVYEKNFPVLFKLDRAGAIARYREYLDHKLKEDHAYLLPLYGKILVCFCKPLACHGDVIVEKLT